MKKDHTNKKKLPKGSFIRYGHLSHMREQNMIKKLGRDGAFYDWVRKAKKILGVS